MGRSNVDADCRRPGSGHALTCGSIRTRQESRRSGLGEATDFQNAFPAVAYGRIAPDQSLPSADKSFAIATSNAVLEHVRRT